MLLASSPGRLALLAVVVFTAVIVSLQQTSYSRHLTNAGISPFSSSHNGKGRSGNDPTWGHISRLITTTAQAIAKPAADPLPHRSSKQIQSSFEKLHSQWKPPKIPKHWPGYEWYAEASYDPNLWEGFEWDNDYYVRNGIKKLANEQPGAAEAVPYLPYPAYNSPQWKSQWLGEYVPCVGARGKLLNESSEDWLKAYPMIPKGFPKPSIGDAAVTGTDAGYCFDRYHRFGPYGFGQNVKRRMHDWEQPRIKPGWSSVKWGRLQAQCLDSNIERYRPSARHPIDLQPGTHLPDRSWEYFEKEESQLITPHYHHRTAFLIRTWEDYHYTENDMEAIRAMITELSLLSGGEYQVFLFVNIKDPDADLNDPEVRGQLLVKNVPHEFHSISVLWNEGIVKAWYPKVGDWQVYWHQYMSLQWFSKMNPEFDYVWNWETDARYTGSHYQLLEQLTTFSKGVPRKYLWERNQRFYIPAAHGSYEQFLADTDATVEGAVKSAGLETVWGPQPYNRSFDTIVGSQPPRSQAEDDFEWGVGEEADLITLQPIWDPTHTAWTYRDKIFNFVPDIRPRFTKQDPLAVNFTHSEFVNIPRRTYINTVSRFSKRQLHAMHIENLDGRTMQAEMWPATVALQHALKAVYAPHPIWTDRKWPGWYMDAVFNADGGSPASWGARGDSVYNHDREHNFYGWSWYYSTDFPRTLYHRWLGWGVRLGSREQYPNNPLRALGGVEFEERGIEIDVSERGPDISTTEPAESGFISKGKEMVGGQGRMCLPPMLLHPVKKVVEEEIEES